MISRQPTVTTTGVRVFFRAPPTNPARAAVSSGGWEDAINTGLITRTHIAGRWIYLTPSGEALLAAYPR